MNNYIRSELYFGMCLNHIDGIIAQFITVTDPGTLSTYIDWA